MPDAAETSDSAGIRSLPSDIADVHRRAQVSESVTLISPENEASFLTPKITFVAAVEGFEKRPRNVQLYVCPKDGLTTVCKVTGMSFMGGSTWKRTLTLDQNTAYEWLVVVAKPSVSGSGLIASPLHDLIISGKSSF